MTIQSNTGLIIQRSSNMATAQASIFTPVNKYNQIEKLEILLVEANHSTYALRAGHVSRLVRADRVKLNPVDSSTIIFSAYLGFSEQLDIHIFDLNALLGGMMDETLHAGEQIIIMNDPLAQSDMTLGFRVSSTSEVLSITLNELVALPLVVEYNRESPAAWALWLRPTDKTTEIVCLIDPITVILGSIF